MKVGTTDGPAKWLAKRFESVADSAAATEVLLVHQTTVDAAFLEAYPSLRGIVRLGVGYDKVDLAACRARNIDVANIPDYCTEEVALSAVAFALDWARGHAELEGALHAYPEPWQALSLDRVKGVSQLTFGAIGVGRIGGRALNLAAGLGFQVTGYDTDPARCVGVDSLDALLAGADIVSLHVPLATDTRGMLRADFFQRMRPGAMLINTARGGLLGDSHALIAALETGQLAGAALDVLPEEPHVERSPVFRHWHLGRAAGRLRITPHNAFHSQASAQRLLQFAGAEVDHLAAHGRFKNSLCRS